MVGGGFLVPQCFVAVHSLSSNLNVFNRYVERGPLLKMKSRGVGLLNWGVSQNSSVKALILSSSKRDYILITWLKLNIKTAWAKKEQLAEAMMTSILSLPTSDIPEKFWHLVKCKCLKTPIKFHSLFQSKEFTQDLKFIYQVPQTPLEQVMVMLSNPDFMPCPIGRSPGHPSLSKLESSEHALEPSFSDDSQCSVSRGSTWWGPGLPG